MKSVVESPKKALIKWLWSEDATIYKCLKDAKRTREARDKMFDYLNDLERSYYNIFDNKQIQKINVIEKNNAKECIRVLKNLIRTENEQMTGFSALKTLLQIAQNNSKVVSTVHPGFLLEFIYLFRGINAKSKLTEELYESMDSLIGRKSAIARSKKLDEYAERINYYISKYISGLDRQVVQRRTLMKNDILKYFKASEQDWLNPDWHLRHVIKDSKTISALVSLSRTELQGLHYAEKNHIPFQITPYYLSLFNKNGCEESDRAIRAQVLPTLNYCQNVVANRNGGGDLDFMGEKATSPIDAITRRYPQICILKPFDSCPQICVYCQRNWEIKGIEEGCFNSKVIHKAIDWVRKNKSISEVLVTGGDPLTLSNRDLDKLLSELAGIKHVERIRIGTRTLVTLPCRIDEGFINLLKKYHRWGEREVCIITHFEHAAEITPDTIEAVNRLKKVGVNIYNQQVFTYYNSRKFETAFLRKKLKIAGIDPYYSFNTKGKEETRDFRVPIARIEQERKEEARLLPGIIRTDEPVFNVPKLGKSHLRAWQDHEIIMVLKDGRRVYRFYPWESKVGSTMDYIYTDVSIYDYLARLHKDGEAIENYASIWFYF